MSHIYNGGLIKENSVIIDIGALYGDWTEKFIKRHNCYVEAYEPSRDNFERLKKLESDKVKCFPYAVGNFDGEKEFYVYGYGWDGGANSLIRHDGGKHTFVESYTVKVVSLNKILSKHREIELLKIDCEGCEIDILKHSKIEELIKCKQITVEFHAFCPHLHISNEDVQECINRLSSYFTVKRTNKNHPDYLFMRKT